MGRTTNPYVNQYRGPIEISLFLYTTMGNKVKSFDPAQDFVLSPNHLGEFMRASYPLYANDLDPLFQDAIGTKIDRHLMGVRVI